MNNLLSISKRLESGNIVGGGGRHFPKNGVLTHDHVLKLKKNLEEAHDFWKDEKNIEGALLEVTHDRIVSKSNRIHLLFSGLGKTSEGRIVGAKYVKTPEEKKVHSFTYYLPKIEILEKSISDISLLADYLAEKGDLDQEKLEWFRDHKAPPGFRNSNVFCDLAVDCFFISLIGIPDNRIEDGGPHIVTFYQTSIPSEVFLKKAGIKRVESKKLSENTYLLDVQDLAIIKQEAPFLVSMSVVDLAKIESPFSSLSGIKHDRTLPHPGDEPTIGVLDGPIQKDTYLQEWIESTSYVDEAKPRRVSLEERSHATEVSSLIIDGPGLNEWLEDDCGHFKVRHFAVFRKGLYSTSKIIEKIKLAVSSNPDIKVWNLSLGTESEVSENFISLLGETLDDLQKQYDVIFVVAGTNKERREKGMKRVGEPADSFSSLVVNAAKRNGEPASYSRVGPVLSFIVKPDVAYYGGDFGEELLVQGCGEDLLERHGTSLAAPLIARKVAFLIYKLGLSKEEAKALIINAAKGVEDVNPATGFGIVPIKIEEIVKTRNDELGFIIKGRARTYLTSTHTLPIPSAIDPKNEKEGFPFYVKATLCYFASGNRDEGVDYGGVEMSFSFGRIDEKGKIKSSDAKVNYESYATEEEARTYLKKWNTVKMINEVPKERRIMKKKYIEENYWGFSVTTINRRSTPNYDIPFAIVVTLKEMHGRNRITDFKNLLTANGWQVNEIDMEQHLDIFASSSEDIEFK